MIERHTPIRSPERFPPPTVDEVKAKMMSFDGGENLKEGLVWEERITGGMLTLLRCKVSAEGGYTVKYAYTRDNNGKASIVKDVSIWDEKFKMNLTSREVLAEHDEQSGWRSGESDEGNGAETEKF